MSFIRYKTLKGKKYAYEITAYWDAEKKKSKQKNKYLGIVDADGNIVKSALTDARVKEKFILDFGDGYFLHEAIKNFSCYGLMQSLFTDFFDSLMVMIFYRIIMTSALYNCETWLSGNILSILHSKAAVSSQETSRILSALGEESLQREFFSRYIQLLGGSQKSVIIDATSLPNDIHSGFNQWGKADGSIEKQFRLLCVLDQKTQQPLFYRYLPGNIIDVSTLKTTMRELTEIGVKSSFILLDAGYFSKENIQELQRENIDFVTRLPSSRSLYKNLMREEALNIESPQNVLQYGSRAMFAFSKKITLYEKEAHAHIIMDPYRKGKEMNKLIIDHFSDADSENEIDSASFRNCGVMILISSKPISAQEAVSTYYMRLSIERVFSYTKTDLGILPIRRHNESTIRGYLFLQFLSLIFYISLTKTLHQKLTVEQALMSLRQLKCKVFDKKIIVAELQRKHKEIFKLFSILVPNSLGI